MTLLHLNHGRIGDIPASPLTVKQALIFRETVSSPVSGFDDLGQPNGEAMALPPGIRGSVTQCVATAYAAASPPAFAVAVISYLFLLLARRKVKSANVPGLSVLVLTALLVAVLSRAGLLGLLEATSIPSDNMLYLLPVVPCYLLFVVISICQGAEALRNIVLYRRAHV